MKNPEFPPEIPPLAPTERAAAPELDPLSPGVLARPAESLDTQATPPAPRTEVQPLSFYSGSDAPAIDRRAYVTERPSPPPELNMQEADAALQGLLRELEPKRSGSSRNSSSQIFNPSSRSDGGYRLYMAYERSNSHLVAGQWDAADMEYELTTKTFTEAQNYNMPSAVIPERACWFSI